MPVDMAVQALWGRRGCVHAPTNKSMRLMRHSSVLEQVKGERTAGSVWRVREFDNARKREMKERACRDYTISIRLVILGVMDNSLALKADGTHETIPRRRQLILG